MYIRKKTNSKRQEINNKSYSLLKLIIAELTNTKGYSLLELIIVSVVGLSILATSARMYVRFTEVQRREERLLLVQRSLLATQANLKKSLTTLPGRGLATTNGQAFSLPLLPSIGSAKDSSGKVVPVRLGVVTPYKLNGYDAFTIAYADSKIPRLAIASNTKVDLNTGKITIALPQAFPGRPPIVPRGGIITPIGTPGGTTIGGLTGSSIKSGNGISNSGTGDGTSNIIVPINIPTPTPTPSPVATPAPAPVPPNVPFDSTLLGDSWIPTTNTFHVGDVMMMVDRPQYSDTQSTTTQTKSRLIQITGVRAITPTLSQGGQFFIELTFDYCKVGDCGTQFPGLTNTFDAPTIGAALIPLKLTSFYVKSDSMGIRIIRNNGGIVTIDASGNATIQGGSEDTQGELLGNLGVTANFNVTYHLKDGTTQPTPINPAVSWLNNVISTDVSISSEVPATKGTERINHRVNISFPTIMKSLE